MGQDIGVEAYVSDLLRGQTVPHEMKFRRANDERLRPLVNCFLRGLAFAGVGVCAARNCFHNQLVALYQRVVKKRQDPDPTVLKSFQQWVVANMQRLFPRGERVVPVLWEFWNSRFPGKVQEENAEAHRRIENHEVTMADFRRNSFFVKIETQWKWFLAHVLPEEWAPRCIINASIYVRNVLGPWMYSFAKALKRNWSVTRRPLAFESGYTSVQVGEWLHHWSQIITDGEFFEIDYSRWDSSISVPLLKTTGIIYSHFGLEGFAKKVFEQQYKLRASSAGIWFEREGMVASGVPNTTVGNSLLNGLITVYLFEKAGGKLGRDFAVMVRGDDMIAVVRRGLCLNFASQAKGFGLSPKLKRGHPIEKVSFCSNAFYPAIHKGKKVWAAAPTLKAMLKVAWTTSVVPLRFWASHARGVALGLIQLVNHIPIFAAYLNKVLSFATTSKGEKYVQAAIDKAHVKYIPASGCDVDDDVRCFLSRRYDISIAILEQCQRDFEKFTGIGTLGTPCIEQLVKAVGAVEA